MEATVHLQIQGASFFRLTGIVLISPDAQSPE